MVLHSSLESRSPAVSACSRAAVKRGVRSGMPVAEARTLTPHGWFAVHDPDADTEGLRRLAWQCQRFAPLAGLEPADAPDCLWLNVTGCVHLFGDLTALLSAVTEHFEQQGYRLCIAAAATFGAAWGLARFGGRPCGIVDADRLQSVLCPLPLAALRLPTKVLELLAECGLRTIGQLLAIPRSTLPARFGPDVLKRLDQAFGHAGELLEPEIPPQPIRADARFESPLTDTAAVLYVLRRLLARVLDQLHQSHRETQHVVTSWRTEAGESGEFDLRLLRPTGSADRLWELLTLKLDGLQLPGAIVGLGIEAIPCRLSMVNRKTLFDDDETHAAEFLNLIERLSSRLGERSVVRCRLLPEYQPELACAVQPWLSGIEDRKTSSEELEKPALRVRPLRLFPSPVPASVSCDDSSGLPQAFQWQRREHVIALCEGPERISTGWWRAASSKRAYFRVETTTGQRFWLFQRLDSGQWFLQGVFE